MSYIYIDQRNRKPIYEQVVDQIKELVLRKVIAPDEQLPSVRQLSSENGINPNTVQKAYAELERQGIIYSVPGRGSFVSTNTDLIAHSMVTELLQQLETKLREAYQAKVDMGQIEALVAKIWRAEA